MNKKLIFSIIAVVAIAVLIAGGVYYFGDDSQDQDTQNTESTESDQSSQSDQQADQDDSNLSEFVGTYEGRGALISGAFQFPDSSFTLTSNDTFEFDARGLDLTITQNPALAINGSYPIANIRAEGRTQLPGDGSVSLLVQQLGVEFLVAGQTLDPATTQSLIQALQTTFNFTLPEATQANPYTIDMVIAATQTGQIDISNQPGSTDQIYVSFSGEKSQ